MDLSDDTGEVAADEDLYQIWMVYTSTNDLQQFKRYLRCFLEVYKAYVDVELNHLITGFTAEGPHLTKLPDGILQAVGRQLSLTSDLYIQVQEPEALQYCQQLIKCLIVICRNLDNVAFVASCDYVGHIVTMATVVLSKISSDGGECSVEEEGKRTQLKSFVSHVIHFFECMYDPYFVWRRRLRGLLEEDYTECIWWTVEKSRFKFRPAVLHVEVVPFFYECFQQPNLDMDVQIRLFHLFGAIIAGAQHNALKAICPATLDVLLKVLSRPSNIPSENTSHTTSESARLGVASSTIGMASSMQQAINTVMMVKDLVLRCIIRMVHVIHCCSPDQRQVEVGAVLEGYYQALLRISEHHSPESFQLQLTMINNIQEMLQCPDHSALQVIFVAEGTFETFVTFLHRTPLRGVEAQKVAMGIIRVMSAVMSGSNTAKDKFREKVGYHKFVEALKSLGQPSQELLKTLMDLVIEDTHVDGKSYSVQNAQAALMLVQWLPDIQEHELQILLTECLLLLANASNYNQMALCNEGMVGAILHILHREKQINNQAVMYLIQLLDTLGSLSITGAELKQLICLLKPDEDDHIIPYAGKLIKSLSSMSHKNTRQGALHYFDFQTPDAGILVPGIRKWPGAGFTFHAWVCLEQQDALRQVMARRQLYSFCSGTGSGFEAFFTPGNILVVCVCIKKEFHTVAVTDHPITDQEWHCIDIVHTSSKGPFSKSQLTVYIDGRPRLSAFVKYPPLSEPLNVCCIGLCPRAHYDKSHDYSVPSSEQKKGWVPFKIPLVKSINQSPSVVSVPGHDLDNQFGPPRSFQGQLGSVCLFCDPIMANHITTIFSQGTNNMLLFQSDDGTLTELSSKLLLHYNAKACQTTTCLDLSFNQNHGRLVGNKCTTWDCKEMINCVGGIQVLFPILEHINKMPMLSESGIPMSPTSPRSPASDRDLQEEWVVVRSSSHADAKLDQNQAASFLTLLRNIASSSEVNQELLVQTQGIATLGALLQKVEPHMIDVHVLMAIQLLVETVAESNKTLLYHIYQYMLFDFRIWSRSEFPVRIGHIQYLSTIIKEDRKYFRKKYGVQYMLDVIRAYYSKSAESKPSADDCRTIRVSLLGLVKYYVVKEITADELNCLLGFIAAVNEQELIMEALDLLMSLILRSGKKDQIFLLIFEDGKADILCNLLAKQYSTSLKEKVLKLYSVLMKTDKVYDKNKSVLRFHERGFYPGLVSLMQTSEVSLDMAKYMLDQVLATDTAAGYDAALAVLQLLHHSTLPIKLEATRKLMVALFAKPSAAKTFAKQVGWQDALVRLLILKPKPATTKIYTTTEQGTFEQQPANKEKDNIHSANQEKDTIHSTNQEKDNINSTNQNENEKSLLTVFPPFEDATNHSIPVIDVENGAKFSLGESPSENLNSLSHSVSDHSIPRFSRTILFEDPAQSDVDLSRSSTASAEDLGASGKEGCDSLVAMATAPSESSINSNETNTLDAPSLSSNQDCSSSQATEAPSISDVTDSSNLLESQDNTDISDALRRMGLSLKRDENMEMTEELCQNLLIILFTVMWKGVEGADNKAWKERGQVFGAISYTSESHELLKPKVELTRKLIEMMLQGCIMDLKETGQTNVNVTMNSLEMVKTIYNFLCFDDTTPPKERFNERIIEDVMTLLDLMTVWELENSWREMEQLGLSILLAFAAQDDLNLCSIAAARLHNLLQTRPVDKLQESCYIMGAINGILTHALLESLDHYSFLIPVMKALVDKCSDLLNMKTYLPSLPATTMSPNFFDDFKTYCQSEEWRTFMEKQVLPSKFQYEANMFDEMQVSMKTYIGECHEEMMMDSHKRNRERGESKLKFESNIVEAFRSRAKLENKRYSNILTQMRNQNASVMRQWRATKLFFTGERGSWAEGYQLTQYWKLSNQENFSRMRPKLVPNYNFDPHLEASRLRDNQGAEEGPREVLPPIEVVKEAKVTGDDIGDDRLGDEEWNVISSANTTAAEELIGKEKLILSEDCELVTIMDVHRGRLEVTTTHIYFFDCSLNKEEGGGEDFKLALAQLREIHFRRYNLRRSALEIFLIDQSNYFLNFQKKIRNKVYSRILSLHPPNLIYYGSRSPAELLKASGLTQKWVQREISNFDYLMQLNTIAGRTYNDLSQYPVFPWILQDYVSENLDLENPHVFRDLSKPIGIINPNNEKEVKDKYDHFEDPTGTIEKFHYGTHYSNPAAVMTYLIRMEPFTTLHIELQSGKFDVADRQFYSIPATWQGLMENPNDVKELIPEFYYMPEFLENMNEFDLGKMQITEEVVSEVILPPWADSPEDFIYKHRKALESEYVSAHLHEWIDLIFGYKQKGAPAAEATNVFYYCTYEGAVDLDAITDPVQRKALEGMINNFGQTPCQLLKEAHPRRMTFEEAVTRASKIDRSLNLLWFHDQLKAFYVEAAQDTDPLAFVTVPRNQARSFIQHGMPDSMIGVTEDGVLAIHGWLPYDKSISNYFTFEKDPSVSNSNNGKNKVSLKDALHAGKTLGHKIASNLVPRSKKRLAGPFAPGLKVTEKLFAVSHDAKLVLSGGHWDNSLRAYSIPKSKNVSHIIRHTDIVTCISLDYCGSHLISGSRDTTCMVWELLYQNGSCSGLGGKPLQVLYGHDSEVTSVAISVELDLAVSGSKDGTVIIHTVRRGHYMRTLRPPGELGWKICIQQLTLSDIGQIVLYCTEHHPTKPNTAENLALHVYSINGKHLSYEILSQPIRHMVVTEGHVLIGSTHGSLIIKEVFGLKTLTTMPLHVPVQCVSVTNGNSHALVGLKDGKLIIIGIKKQAELKYKTGLDKILLTANSPLSD